MRLADIRSRVTQLYILIAWLHVPAAALIALNARNTWLAPTAFLALVALVATICARTMKDRLALRMMLAIALALGPIAFVYAWRGDLGSVFAPGDWQIHYRMYVLAAFAIVAECSVLISITTTISAVFRRVDQVIEVTTRATAEAIAMELDEKAVLHAELDRLRRSA